MDSVGERGLTEYNFDEQNKIEEKFTPMILQYLREQSGMEPEDVRTSCLEYDFKLGNLRFDLKADTRISATSNFFIETESVKVTKKGWLFNQNADYILYLDTQNFVLYWLNLKRLQAHEKEIKKYPAKTITQDANYVTSGHVVPIEFVTRIALIRKIDLKKLCETEAKK
jgi:hypothetical protein